MAMMKKSVPAVSPDAYVDALSGWQRTTVYKGCERQSWLARTLTKSSSGGIWSTYQTGLCYSSALKSIACSSASGVASACAR